MFFRFKTMLTNYINMFYSIVGQYLELTWFIRAHSQWENLPTQTGIFWVSNLTGWRTSCGVNSVRCSCQFHGWNKWLYTFIIGSLVVISVSPQRLLPNSSLRNSFITGNSSGVDFETSWTNKTINLLWKCPLKLYCQAIIHPSDFHTFKLSIS